MVVRRLELRVRALPVRREPWARAEPVTSERAVMREPGPGAAGVPVAARGPVGAGASAGADGRAFLPQVSQ
jgi:hypothetical protein